jgi:hypothetical protein
MDTSDPCEVGSDVSPLTAQRSTSTQVGTRSG